MRALPLAASLLVGFLTLASPASAELSGGPYVGTVSQGSADPHSYTSHPPGTECLAIYQPHLYTVRLEYAPPTDVLTLTVGSVSDVGSNGVASISFVANYCYGFDFSVSGTQVADNAAYLVTVSSVRQGPDLICCLS